MKTGWTAAWIGSAQLLLAFGTVTPAQETPFRLGEDQFVIVSGSIGAMEDLDLLIDTGASTTLVSSHLAEAFERTGVDHEIIAGPRKLQVEEVRLPDLAMGSIRFEDVTVRSADFSHLRKSIRPDVIVGLDLLKQTPLVIDYEARTIGFGGEAVLTHSLSFYPGLPVILVPVMVGGSVLHLALDTGAGLVELYQRPRGLDVIWSGGTRLVHTLSGRSRLREIQLREVRLGADFRGQVRAFFVEGGSLVHGLGDGVLSPVGLGLKRIQIDFQRAMLSWE